MITAARWLAVASIAATAVAVAGCSVSHRSGDFTCERQTDCSNGRSCVDGFCVLPEDAGLDGARVDAAVCPSVCTSCALDQKLCTIDCALNGGCKQLVTCPLGFACNVLCSEDNACSSGLNCTGGTSCKVTCSGTQSCRNLSCGLGPCNVSCTGNASCGEIACGNSCSCDVSCSASALCRNLTCKQGCAASSRSCTSLPLGCNTCR